MESEKSGLKLRFADSEQCYLLSDRLIEFAHPNVEAIRAGNSLSVTIDKSDQHSSLPEICTITIDRIARTDSNVTAVINSRLSMISTDTYLRWQNHHKAARLWVGLFLVGGSLFLPFGFRLSSSVQRVSVEQSRWESAQFLLSYPRTGGTLLLVVGAIMSRFTLYENLRPLFEQTGRQSICFSPYATGIAVLATIYGLGLVIGGKGFARQIFGQDGQNLAFWLNAAMIGVASLFVLAFRMFLASAGFSFGA